MEPPEEEEEETVVSPPSKVDDATFLKGVVDELAVLKPKFILSTSLPTTTSHQTIHRIDCPALTTPASAAQMVMETMDHYQHTAGALSVEPCTHCEGWREIVLTVPQKAKLFCRMAVLITPTFPTYMLRDLSSFLLSLARGLESRYDGVELITMQHLEATDVLERIALKNEWAFQALPLDVKKYGSFADEIGKQLLVKDHRPHRLVVCQTDKVSTGWAKRLRPLCDRNHVPLFVFDGEDLSRLFPTKKVSKVKKALSVSSYPTSQLHLEAFIKIS